MMHCITQRGRGAYMEESLPTHSVVGEVKRGIVVHGMA